MRRKRSQVDARCALEIGYVGNEFCRFITLVLRAIRSEDENGSFRDFIRDPIEQQERVEIEAMDIIDRNQRGTIVG